MEGTEATTIPARSTSCRRCGGCINVIGRRGPVPFLCDRCKAETGSRRIHHCKCKNCGRDAWTGTPQQFCSVSCRGAWAAAAARTMPCKRCGKSFRCALSAERNGRAYCSAECRRHAWGQTTERIVCAVCGAQFVKRRASSSYRDRNLCCSRECGHEMRRRQGEANRAEKAEAARLAAEQRSLAKQKKQQLAAEAVVERAKRKRTCLECGRLFRDGLKRLCSAECRAAALRRNKKAGKRSRAHSSHYVRCERKGLPFDKAVTAKFVHQRDRGICLLCGRKTIAGDKRKAPSVGHIVPLNNPLNTRHGHTADNTCTNCSECNGRQGNAVIIDGHQLSEDPRRVLLDCIQSTGYPLQQTCHSTQDPWAARQ